MTFARLVLAAATNDPIPEPKDGKLPPRQTAHAIIQYYMTSIYSLFPVFPETVLISILDDLYQQDQPQIKSSDYWLFYMVLAIGSAAQSRSNRDEYYTNGVEFVARALPYADRALTPGYVTQIQSLLLFAQYAMLDPAHFDTWHLIGFACRAVIDLGYHQDPPQAQAMDKGALDSRRKIFYCAYALDRAISMVHARAFSFTDDAIAVDLPSPSPMSQVPSISGSIAEFSSADIALLHFRLRRIQSHWYQTLFQSDPADPLPDSTSFIWQMCHDMREWAESLPDTLPVGFRELFDLELRYSYVYCIAPSARAPHLTAYGRILIFEHAIAYLDRIYAVASAATNPALYTYHDAFKVYFMGSQFVAVLRDAGDALLSGGSSSSNRNVPVPLSPPNVAPPPPLPPQQRRPAGEEEEEEEEEDNLDRSARSLERVGLALGRYGERWEDALALRDSFERMSADVANGLAARRRLRDENVAAAAAARAEEEQMRLRQMATGHHHHHQQQQQHMHAAQNHARPQQGVQWAGVDVAQMMQGGNQYGT